MDALRLDYVHSQFDLVCDLSILEYCYLCEEPDIKVRQLLEEVHRVLAVDGQALFLTIRAPEEVYVSLTHLFEWWVLPNALRHMPNSVATGATPA